MSVKNLAVTFLALTLVACSTSEESTDSDRDDSADVVEDILLNGGALAHHAKLPAAPLPKPTLPACGEELCGEDAPQGGCCMSDQGTICYSCQLPQIPSECEEDADCGDVELGDRCAVNAAGEGTCYRACGGGLGFVCEEGDVCLTPFVTLELDGSGVCMSPPSVGDEAAAAVELELDENLGVDALRPADLADGLKGGIEKNVVSE